MKIMHEQVRFPETSKIKVKWTVNSNFTYPWHFHSQYELIYLIKGSAVRFVGDSIEHIEGGDIVLIGNNLPHLWQSTNRDKPIDFLDKQEGVEYIVIQFSEDFFEESISKYVEFSSIKDLLERASRGVCFSSEGAEDIVAMLSVMDETSGFSRVIKLLELLHLLSKHNSYRLLAGEYYTHDFRSFSSNRLECVISYINKNYRDSIDLATVAEIANMHPSAFCRFFKEKSSRSLSEYVNDLRIGYACKLIIEGRMSISQICFESGFNNLSNFNRTFKKQTGYSPSKYKRSFSD